jgi:hypothetical protein
MTEVTMPPLLDMVRNILELHQHLSTMNQRIQRLERRMASLTETITIIGAATDRQGEGIRAVATQLEELRSRVAAGDTTAIELLTPIAARLNEHADALSAMANPATPTDPVPVPAPDPEPVPE